VAVMLPTTTPLTIRILTEKLSLTIPEGSPMTVWESDSSHSTRPWTVRSSSPESLPLIRIDCPITVLPVSELPLAMGSALLHVHVDVALEGGTVRNQDPGGADVAHHAAVALELDLVAGGNVPGDAAGDLDVLRLDVCLHHAAALDEEALAQGDLPLHGPLDDEVLVARDLSVNDNARADDRIGHVVPSLDVVRKLHVHLNGAVEHGPILDDDARGLHVSGHLGRRVDRHA